MLPELNELFWQTQEIVSAIEGGLGVRPLHLKRRFFISWQFGHWFSSRGCKLH